MVNMEITKQKVVNNAWMNAHLALGGLFSNAQVVMALKVTF